MCVWRVLPRQILCAYSGSLAVGTPLYLYSHASTTHTTSHYYQHRTPTTTTNTIANNTKGGNSGKDGGASEARG